ncbi:MAG TPA: methylated-DNA--[protein]-cysteine S-methyltransferase [Desulfobulbus sp.]|nr:methylated-DNA--[protein]-cysteine S-methyltransferase [Desulfobulbus sp.]
MKDRNTYYRKISSPIGQIYITADNDYLRTITFADTSQDVAGSDGGCIVESNPIIQQTEEQLRQYFALKRTAFDLPITFTGTEFQRKTWQSLLGIPYGETRSYSQQARAIGNPKAVRAVGRTNGLNPIAIVVPCHRVIGKSGKLTGYAGGLDRKKFLLDLERKNR